MEQEKLITIDFDELTSNTNLFIFYENNKKENKQFLFKVLKGYYYSLIAFSCFAFLIMPT